ncbi:MAG TPA: hypothetical protein VFH45_13495 [Acidimicrobiales bacterium]|nr:hypothetical protein [Acidimicrobiales bacterium]
MRRKLAAVVLGVALAASACGGRGAVLGTTSSTCFHALPPAADAVKHQGRLVGVRLIEVRRLHRLPAPERLGTGRVCLVAFAGHYDSSALEEPLNAAKGAYAVVAVRPDGSDVFGTYVVDKLPLVFHHL